MSKDYYKILGIAEFETAENIKSAYRRLARKWHPDIAGNTSEAMKRFKEINEAYEILSNQTKKAEYDRARKFYNYATAEKKINNETFKETTNPQQKDIFSNFSDFFSRKSNANTEKEIKIPKRGNDIFSEIEISVLESITGTNKIINILQTRPCPKCNGRKFINGSLCQHCQGKGEISNYKKFTIKIPEGISNKSKIRLAGEGEPGVNGGLNGDLYLTINIKEPKEYKTEGLNILKTIAITPFEAVLGTTIKISTLDGIINFKIAPMTQNGQKIRLAGCGFAQNEKFGDMIITIEIKIPTEISAEEISLYKKLSKLSASNIRDTDYDR